MVMIVCDNTDNYVTNNSISVIIHHKNGVDTVISQYLSAKLLLATISQTDSIE